MTNFSFKIKNKIAILRRLNCLSVVKDLKTIGILLKIVEILFDFSLNFKFLKYYESKIVLTA